MPSISETTLRQRARSGRVCVVHSGKVYDVTDFADKHPGGLGVLREHSGKDVTQLMQESNPHRHSKAAYTILNKYYIGDVGSVDSKTQVTPPRRAPVQSASPASVRVCVCVCRSVSWPARGGGHIHGHVGDPGGYTKPVAGPALDWCVC